MLKGSHTQAAEIQLTIHVFIVSKSFFVKTLLWKYKVLPAAKSWNWAIVCKPVCGNAPMPRAIHYDTVEAYKWPPEDMTDIYSARGESSRRRFIDLAAEEGRPSRATEQSLPDSWKMSRTRTKGDLKALVMLSRPISSCHERCNSLSPAIL